jgi:hypothetical protein
MERRVELGLTILNYTPLIEKLKEEKAIWSGFNLFIKNNLNSSLLKR